VLEIEADVQGRAEVVGGDEPVAGGGGGLCDGGEGGDSEQVEGEQAEGEFGAGHARFSCGVTCLDKGDGLRIAVGG
jgi:hypothetical protein